MGADATSETLDPKIKKMKSDEATISSPEKPKEVRRRQFQPGMRLKDSRGQQYWTDKHGSLRRVEGGKLSKAEKKAAKRRQPAERRQVR